MPRTIPLSQGRVALVDDADYTFLMHWPWHLNNMGYAVRGEGLLASASVSTDIASSNPGHPTHAM